MRLIVPGALVAVVVLAIVLVSPAIVTDLDGRTYDAVARAAGPGRPSGRVVVVAIDEASLAQVGRWPWPRDQIANVIRRLQEAGASAVMLDLMFPEEQPKPAAPPAGGPGAGAASAPDRELARAVAGAPVVLGYYFGLDGAPASHGECGISPRSLVIEQSPSVGGPLLFRAASLLCNAPEIARGAASAGFLNGAPDSDGRLRRLPLLIEYEDRIYPSLALAAFLVSSHSRWMKLAGDGAGTATLRVDLAEVPLGRRGDLLLRFRGKAGSIVRVAAIDVLSRRVPAGTLRGMVAVVGSVAAGVESTVATPVDPFLPGVEVQATALDNLLRQDFFSRPAWARVAELAAGLLGGWAAAAMLLLMRPAAGVAALGGLCALGWLGSLAGLGAAGVYISPLPLLLTAIAEFAVLTPARAAVERSRVADLEARLAAATQFTLSVLRSLAAKEDQEADTHFERMRRYMKVLCNAAARRPEFRKTLTRETAGLLVELAPVRDLGRIGVPAEVLASSGPLTLEQWEAMKTHVAFGYEILERARAAAGGPDDGIYRLALEIVRSHHERWDGRGYPEGLARDRIPLSARLLAVADVYDALVSGRPYRVALRPAEAAQKIVAGSGSQFDPAIVSVFVEVKEAWQQVAEELPGGGKSS